MVKGLTPKQSSEFDGVLVAAIVDAGIQIAEKITDEVERSLMISYINQLHKGIRQRDEVVDTLITHIKNIKKKGAK